MNRQNIAKLNSGVAIGSKAIAMIISVVSRRVFLQFFGSALLGLSSVTTEVISLLSLSELGFATVFLYLIYKPFAEKDYQQVATIMRLYKRIYSIIGLMVLIIGLFLSIFLGFFIDLEEYGANLVYLVYYIVLLANVSTYFLGYRRAIFSVDQKVYVVNIVDTIVNTLLGIARILSIIIIHNFILYLVLEVIQNVVGNLITYVIYDKRYKYISELKPGIFEKKKDLFKSVKHMVGGKIANYIYKSTDSLVVSHFLGAGMVGYLVNYAVLRNYIKQVVESIASPIVPMMGNYVRSEFDLCKVKLVFYAYTYIRYSIVSVFCCGFAVMGHQLIGIWLGDQYRLSTLLVFLMAIDLLLSNIMGPSGDYLGVLGHFRYEQNVCFCGAGINILTSVIFVNLIGMEGVLVGTVLSQVFFMVFRAYGIFKYYFKDGLWRYILTEIGMISHFILSCILSFAIINAFTIENRVLSFLIGGCICVFINVTSNVILYFKTRMFGYTADMFLKRRKG